MIDPENKDALNSANVSKTTPDNEVSTEEVKSQEQQSTIFVKHIYDTKKPAKNGNVKRIIICAVAALVCVAVICGAIGFDKLFYKENTSSTTSVEGQDDFIIIKMADIVKPSFVDIDGERTEVDTNIESFHIVNNYEEFTVKPYFVKAEKEENSSSSSSTTASSSASGTASGAVSSTAAGTSSSTTSSESKTYLYDTTWFVEGINRDLTDSMAIADKIRECLTVRGFREMENTFATVEEYHEYYGMEKKLNAGCVVNFTDGTAPLTISLGSALATGDAFYFKTSLSDKIYVISEEYAENYAVSTKELADSTVVEKLTQTEANKSYYNEKTQALAKFDYIKISGDVFGGKSYEFSMATGKSSEYLPYLMTTPYHRAANDSFIASILGLTENGIDASALYSYQVTDKDINECGFDNPKCILEVKVGDRKYKLILGGYRNDGTETITAMVEGKPQVFGISTEDVGFLINASNDITKMFNDAFVLEDIYTVKSFEIGFGSGQHKFDMTHTLREGETNVYDTVVKKGDTVMNTKSLKLIYQRVLMLTMTEFVTEAEHAEAVLTIKFNFIDGSKSKVVEFTEAPDDIYHYTVWVDGTPLGEVIKSSVTDITDCLDIYLSGGEVPDTW